MDLLAIGDKIRSLRRAAGLTQEELAERMNVSPQAVSKWENGHCLPETALLPKLSQLLECSIDDILNAGNGNKEESAAEQKTVIIEPKIIRKGELIVAGAAGDGTKTAELWQEYMRLEKEAPLKNKKEEGGYEIRLYDDKGQCECWVGQNVKTEINDENYSSIKLSDVLYAVFEIYPARGYGSQNTAMDRWLESNKNKYEQLKEGGRHYVIEYYDERYKGNEDPDSIVEIWIPVMKI
jgi:transcriptional regulator with XRE-family HTH domain